MEFYLLLQTTPLLTPKEQANCRVYFIEQERDIVFIVDKPVKLRMWQDVRIVATPPKATLALT